MSRRKLTTTAVVAVVVFFAVAAFVRLTSPREDVGGIVLRALTGGVCTSYIASVENSVTYNGKNIKSRATVYHTRDAEKVVYTGAGQQVWSMMRDGKSYTYLPAKKQVLVGESGKVLSDDEKGRLLLANYTMVGRGKQTIAGKNAYVVDIRSRHTGRPNKKIWIEEQFLTILKSIDYNAAGQERGSTETTNIRHNVDIPRDTFEAPQSGNVQMVRTCESGKSAQIFKELSFDVKTPKYLPAGFVLDGYHLYNCQCNCNHRAAQLTYTDGLNVISVFQTPKGVACGTGGCGMSSTRTQKGCAVGNCGIAGVGQEDAGDKTVVVVGDLLPNEIRKITESVE